MKQIIFSIALFVSISCFLTSCYSLTYSVGKGAQTGIKVNEKNHYLMYGLAPVKTSDPIKMAGGVTDYEVNIRHTFVDGLINALTFGIYTPTTTTVIK